MSSRYDVKGYFALAVSVLCMSTAAIFARYADAHAFVKSAYRLTIAVLVMAPCAFIFCRDEFKRLTRNDIGIGVLSGTLLAAHFFSWMSSLDYTTVASSIVLVDTTPLWLAVINMFIGRGMPTKGQWLAIGSSLIGAFLIGWGDISIKGEALIGDALALFGAIVLAGNFICINKLRQKISILPFVTLSYGTASIMMWIVVLAMGLDFVDLAPNTWAALISMSVIGQMIGMTSYNWALGRFTPGFIAIALLGEPVASALWACIVFDEVPPMIAIFGIAILIFSIGIAALSYRDEDQK